MQTYRPVTEAELNARLDEQIAPERAREIDAWLEGHPDEAHRLESYRAHERDLRAVFDPVLDEAPPERLQRAALPRPAAGRGWRVATGIALALAGGVAGWGLRSITDADRAASPGDAAGAAADGAGFARRAAVAHAVYSPEVRRPVEVDAAHEEQLVTWLSRRMGTPMRPPRLQPLGYALEGGRLLPGGQGPVAQFMYRDAAGSRLTLYVTDEVRSSVGGGAGVVGSGGTGRGIGSGGTGRDGTRPDGGPPSPGSGGTGRDSGGAAPSAATGASFRFLQEGQLNVFYWVDGPFGYAISAQVDREVLAQVSAEVWRQLAERR